MLKQCPVCGSEIFIWSDGRFGVHARYYQGRFLDCRMSRRPAVAKPEGGPTITTAAKGQVITLDAFNVWSIGDGNGDAQLKVELFTGESFLFCDNAEAARVAHWWLTVGLPASEKNWEDA